MLEEKDLQAIAEMMKGMESRIDQKLEKQKQDIMHDVKVLLDTEVTTRFNLLAEGQQTILEKLERLDDMEVMDTRITALEAMVKN